MRRKNSGISAILGTVIGILIFFTIIIPTWIYMQQLQTIFFDQVNRRLLFEAEKLRERLDLIVSISVSGTQYHPTLNITNVSPLEVTVLAIYLESNVKGLVQVSSETITLAPGGRRAIVLRGFSMGVDEVVRAIVTTARGNSFISEYSIGPKRLPHIMVVSLANLTVSSAYKVNVESIGSFAGCVMPQGSGLAENRCLQEVTVERFIKVGDLRGGPGGHEEIFAFNVAPGEYTVSTYVLIRDGSGNMVWQALRPPERVTVYDHSTVRFDSTRSYGWRIPLHLNVLATKLVIFNTTVPGSITILNISFVLTYNTSSPGPALDATVEIDFNDATCDGLTMTVKRLKVGESFAGTFQCGIVTGTTVPRVYTFRVFISRVELPPGFGVDQPSSEMTRVGRVDLCVVREVSVLVSIVTVMVGTERHVSGVSTGIREVRCAT